MDKKPLPDAGPPSEPDLQPVPGALISPSAPRTGPPASARQAANRGIALFSGQGARAGYLAAVDQGVISLANFTATLLLARNISPTELGIYGVGFTALRLVRAFQEGLTIQPLNTFGPGMDSEQYRRYSSATTLIQVGLALASSLSAAAGGYILTVLGNDTAGPAMFALWFAFFFWQMQEYVRRALYTRGQVFLAVVNTILANIVRLGLMFWWLSARGLDGRAGLDAIAWGSLVALLPGLWAARSSWTFRWASLRETWARNWEFGRWILGGQLASWVSVEFYPILTAGMISFAAAGAYRAIQNLVAPIHLLLRATDTFLTPRAARAYQAAGLPALRRILRLTYLTAGAPILAMLAFAMLLPRPLLFLLYGETYLEYSPGLALMALFYALWFAYWPLQTVLKAARFSHPIFLANLAAMGAMFTIGIWMITRWGVYGTLGGQVLNAAIVLAVLGAAWKRVSGADGILNPERG